MPRHYDDWLTQFEALTLDQASPDVFRQWTGMYTLCAAMERKTYLVTSRGALFPHLYIIIVARPGIGKTVMTGIARDMLAKLKEVHIAPSSVTKASLIDSLSEATRQITCPEETPPQVSFNSLSVISNELMVLLPAYDSAFLGAMTNLYDAREPYSERRRTNALHIEIPNPQVNLLAATTPGFLHDLMPDGAWDQGFLSRCIIIFSEEEILSSLFDRVDISQEKLDMLQEDLLHIHSLRGEFLFTSGARDMIDEWHKAGGPPRPNHPKLMNYLTRRSVHLLKLCMVSSVSRADDLTITEFDVERSLSWLLNNEETMPDLFKALTGGGDNQAMEELWHFVYEKFMQKKQQPVAERLLVNFLTQRVPSQRVMQLIDLMARAGYFKVVTRPGVGECYIPINPTEMD